MSWIPVDERMPPDVEDVIVVSGGGLVFLARYDCEKYEWFAADLENEKATVVITHWMPLPAPPGRRELIILPGVRPPSWNEFYAGRHWSERAEKAKIAHAEVRQHFNPDVVPFENSVDIEIRVYFNKSPQDCSNIQGKLYEDALKGFYIVDDSPRYVRSIKISSLVDKANPRIEIELIEAV